MKRFSKHGFVAVLIVSVLVLANPLLWAAGKQEAKEAAAAEVTRLVVWDQFFPASQDELMKEFIAQYENKNPDVRIERTVYDTDSIRTVLRPALTSGEGPDVFYYDAGPAFLGAFAEAGLVYDLTKVYQEQGWNAKLVEWPVGRVTYNGKIWGVPNEIEYTNVYYNKRIIEQLGFAGDVVPSKANPNVQTFSSFGDFEAMLQAAEEKGILPIAFGNRDPGRGGHLFSYFATLTAGKEKIDNILFGNGGWDDPEIVQALEMFGQFNKRGFYPDSPNAVSYDEGNALFFAGKAATNITGTWLIADILDQVGDPTDFDFFMLPAVDPSLPLSAGGGIGSTFAVSANSEEKQVAVDFLDFIMTKEAGRKWLLQGSIIPPIGGIDTATLDLPAMTKMAIEGASLPLAYNLDVVMPSEWNDAMKNGLQAIISGSKAPIQVAREMQQAWETAKAEGRIWKAQ